MCAACGIPAHVPAAGAPATPDPAAGAAGQPAKFAALRNPACRVYLIGGALAMMADNVEHVITTRPHTMPRVGAIAALKVLREVSQESSARRWGCAPRSG